MPEFGTPIFSIGRIGCSETKTRSGHGLQIQGVRPIELLGIKIPAGRLTG